MLAENFYKCMNEKYDAIKEENISYMFTVTSFFIAPTYLFLPQCCKQPGKYTLEEFWEIMC